MSSDNTKAKFNIAVVIPALNPISELAALVRELLGNGVARVIVVNDGSDSSSDHIFDEVGNIENCTLLVHKSNMGKGRALKTAFSYFSRNCGRLDGVVTADADGQHSVKDICKISEALSSGAQSLILGVRNFKDPNVPKRSCMGNRMSSQIFKLFYGTDLADTQTGLRGIPARELLWMAELEGDYFEFEINMLIEARRRHLDLIPIPIDTLYFNKNSGSHYNIFKDSFRIFKALVSGLKKRRGEKHEKKQ